MHKHKNDHKYIYRRQISNDGMFEGIGIGGRGKENNGD
jgi:hypothetical protein